MYLSMADAIRRGGPLVAEALPGAPGVAKYPLLWPTVVAGLQAVGASLDGILWINAALWAVVAQMVVSALLPALGASWRAQVAVGAVLAVNTMTMELVPQLMSEPLFTLALTAATILVVKNGSRTSDIVALALCTAVASGTRNVGGLYALVGGGLAVVMGRRRAGIALLLGWAIAAVALRWERSLAPLPTGDSLTLLRYYVSYDVHTSWYRDRWVEGGAGALLRGLRDVVGANVELGPRSLGFYLSPAAWVGAQGGTPPGPGTSVIGGTLLLLAIGAAAPAARARPISALLLLHVAVFLAWTWPFSVRFWLPMFPLVLALAAVAVDSAGNVGRLLLLPVAGLVATLNGIQPFYVARASLSAPSSAQQSAADPEEAALEIAISGLAARVRPGDVLAGDVCPFWLARPLGASAVELNTLVPFADTVAELLHLPAPDAAGERRAFTRNLVRLRTTIGEGRTVWVAHAPAGVAVRRGWIADAVAAGVLQHEAEIGMLSLLSVTPAPEAN